MPNTLTPDTSYSPGPSIMVRESGKLATIPPCLLNTAMAFSSFSDESDSVSGSGSVTTVPAVDVTRNEALPIKRISISTFPMDYVLASAGCL